MVVPGCEAEQINQLPTEILREILEYIPTSELLRSCRLVCQTWYPIATSLCRKRHVKIKQLDDPEDPDCVCGLSLPLHDIFKRDTDLPWSAVRFEFDGRPAMQIFYEDVCESFGSSIQLLATAVHPSQYNHFVRELSKMTNLQEVHIWPNSEDSASWRPFVFPLGVEFQLPKLKQLEIEYGPECQSVDLLEFLLKSGAALKSLKIVELDEVQESEFNRIAQLICASKVEKLSLGLCYRLDQFPTWNILMDQLSSRLGELEINLRLPGNEIWDGDSFDVLERSLAKCTGLRSLILCNFDLIGDGPFPTSIFLQFPTMNHLEHLQIVFGYTGHFNGQYNADPEFPVVSFNLLKSTNFPNLKSVYLDIEDPDDDNRHPTLNRQPLRIDIRKLFDASDNNQFNSVTLLDVGHYHGEGKLSSIFPNLTKISATVGDFNNLHPIFDDMPNLIEADLTLYSNWDNNPLLTRAIPFIQSLEELEKLTVRNCVSPYGGELNEIGLIGLTYLHPVNLIIYNANVKETGDIVALLRTRHTHLQLL